MSAAGGTADTTSPTTPTNITVSGVTATHLHFGWTKSTDNVGVQGYELFLDGTRLGTTPFNSADFFSLVCGRTYTLTVVAFDAAGNRSDRGTGTGTTSACAGSPAPAPAPSPTPAPAPSPSPSTPLPSPSGSLFIAPSGSDLNACSQSAPCASFDRAYHAAGPGQVVQMLGGSYPAQSIKVDAAKNTASANVIFQPAAGATVTLANSTLTISGAHVEFHNLQMSQAGCTNTRVAPPCPLLVIQFPAHDVLVDSLRASRFSITGAYNVTIQNSDFGPSWDNHGIIHADTAGNRPHDITLVNNAVHDQWNSGACKAQAGCISANSMSCGPTINDAYNVVEDHMRFANCEDLGQLVKPYRFANQNITIQNSFFGASNGSNSLALANTAATPNQGLHIRNNTFTKGISVTQGIPYPNSDLTGNVVPSLLCNILASDGWTLSNNTTAPGGPVLCGAGARPTPVPPPPPSPSPPPPTPSPPSRGSTVGASQATCSGGTCTNGIAPSATVNHIVIGAGDFSYYVPKGLQGTAPVVFEAGGGGNCSQISFVWSNLAWEAALNSHRYMAVVLDCPGGSAWDHAEDSQSPSAGNDTAYVKAVVNYLCSGGHTFNGVSADCSRLYFTGGSSGGHMARAVMCSPNTVSLFRAVSIVSASATTPNGTNGNCFYSADKTIFVQYIGGKSSMDPYPATGSWLGFVKTDTYEASYLGCNPTPTNSVTGIVTIGNYSGCGYGKSPEFQSVFVSNGGHSYPGLDGTMGQPGWTAKQAATFFDGTTN